MSLLPFHVLGGAVAIVFGLIALTAGKGGWLHGKSGTVFVYAMLVMSLSGALVAIGRTGAAVNIPAGLVTAYLVVSGLLTIRPPSPRSRRVERLAMFAALAFSGGIFVSSIVSASQGQTAFAVPAAMFGVLALCAGIGDWRMLRAGGLRGRERLRRHLWRMCTALFVASGSFFLGPVRRIPEPLRAAPFRAIPLLVLLAMVYWLWRLRRQRRQPAMTWARDAASDAT